MIAKYVYTAKESSSSGTRESNKIAHINIPDYCPICHSNIQPVYLKHQYNYDKGLFSVFYEWPKCIKTFLAYYDEPSNSMSSPSNYELYPKFATERK